MSDLEPCPFCGQDNDTHRNDCYFMLVSKADAYDRQYPYVSFDKPTKEDIIKAWNNRPTENKIKAEAVRDWADQAQPNNESEDRMVNNAYDYANKLEKGEV